MRTTVHSRPAAPRRLSSSIAAATVALLLELVPLSLGPTAAAADIPPPPRAKLNIHDLKVTASWNQAAGYCTITASAAGYWKRAPERKGMTNGHYLLVKMEVIAPGGHGGTLVKPLAKKTYRSETYSIPHVGLPQRFTWAATHNALHGSGDYGARITVRVVRAVVGAPDTTAWKLVAKTGFRPGCGDGIVSMSP